MNSGKHGWKIAAKAEEIMEAVERVAKAKADLPDAVVKVGLAA